MPGGAPSSRRVRQRLMIRLRNASVFPEPERHREADVGSAQQRRVASPVQREDFAHLGVEPLIGEGVRRELIAQEVADDLLGVCNGVEGNSLASHTR